jgi:hypothetical protein
MWSWCIQYLLPFYVPESNDLWDLVHTRCGIVAVLCHRREGDLSADVGAPHTKKGKLETSTLQARNPNLSIFVIKERHTHIIIFEKERVCTATLLSARA